MLVIIIPNIYEAKIMSDNLQYNNPMKYELLSPFLLMNNLSPRGIYKYW